MHNAQKLQKIFSTTIKDTKSMFNLYIFYYSSDVIQYNDCKVYIVFKIKTL